MDNNGAVGNAHPATMPAGPPVVVGRGDRREKWTKIFTTPMGETSILALLAAKMMLKHAVEKLCEGNVSVDELFGVSDWKVLAAQTTL